MSTCLRNKVVAVVWRKAIDLSPVLIPFLVIFAFLSHSGSADAAAKSCEVLTIAPSGKIVDRPKSLPGSVLDKASPASNDDFAAVVEKISNGMRKGDAADLVSLFHPRLKMTSPVLANTLAELRARYGDPVDIAPLKVMWLDTVDGDPAPIPCDFDGAILNPLYGYAQQASLWLQATGQADIARVMVGIVPVPASRGGGWKIGYFHVQQWTHAGKDPLAWIESARAARDKKQLFGAWTQFDIAEKLLRSSGFASYAVQSGAATERDAIMSRKDWLAKAGGHSGSLSGGPAFEDAVSLLAPGGAGVWMKLRLAKELSTVEIQDHCKSVAKSLTQAKLSDGLSGVRCSYYLPRESLAKDSATGGLFVPF